MATAPARADAGWCPPGLRHTSSLALSNCRDLLRVLEWNEAAGIPFFRICLDMFPWADQYDLEELPDYPEILEVWALTIPCCPHGTPCQPVSVTHVMSTH